MFAVLYLALATLSGFCILTLWIDFNKQKTKVSPWIIIAPGSFLIGVLLMTWITYLVAWVFKNTSNPMLYGNIISFSLILSFICISIYKSQKLKFSLKNILKQNDYLKSKDFLIDISFIAIACMFSIFIMFYTFKVKSNSIYIGYSVYSDFGPHLSLIRSFSVGSNFPTQYPLFPEGNIMYHFMFQFLTGNLEFLGLRIDRAFNIIGSLSLVSFLMLLYSLTVIITGKRKIGLITGILFFFRSSLAFFTYSSEIKTLPEFLNKILFTDIFIGKTQHEEWGLWTQNVYANQRHLAFSLGIITLAIIFFIPFFKKMSILISQMKEKKSLITIKYYLFSKETWAFQNWKESIVIGIILGLIAFWNGAALIAGLSILFIMAIFSVGKLDYLITAGIALLLSGLQSLFFIGANSSPLKPSIVLGFLADEKTLSSVGGYYLELLGIFIFLLIFSFIYLPKLRKILLVFIAPFIIANFLLLTPDLAVNHKYIMISVMFLNIFVATLIYRLFTSDDKKSGTIISIFILLFAVTMLLYPDIAVASGNILKGLFALITCISILHLAFKRWRRILNIVFAVIITLTLTSTGIVDLISLYNINKNSAVYNLEDPSLLWIMENTDKNSVFLTPPYVMHPVLLAGRKIYYGWPYFTWSAGYNTNLRLKTVKAIYEGTDAESVRKSVIESSIDYIVIEEQNRNSTDYILNEQIIDELYEKVYIDNVNKFIIYSCIQE